MMKNALHWLMRAVALATGWLLAGLPLAAKDIYWFDGSAVTYEVQRKYSGVVDQALRMFADDILSVTGRRAQERSGGNVRVYQLDMASNKEIKAIAALKVPVMQFITKPDAYWMGVRGRHLVVVGSNGRGTAYAILQLSRLAGVSPWTGWGGLKPVRKARLAIADDFSKMEIPSVAYRGVEVPLPRDGHRGAGTCRRLFELMLRLRANVVVPGEGGGGGDFRKSKPNRLLADSFDIFIPTIHGGEDYAVPHKERMELHAHGRHLPSAAIELARDDGYGYVTDWTTGDGTHQAGLRYSLNHHGDARATHWHHSLQPGLLYEELRAAWRRGRKAMWLARLQDPLASPYNLSLFLDMAWHGPLPDLAGHHKAWLAELFGDDVAEGLRRPLDEYFRLAAIRRPEFMSQFGEGKGFNAEEFGNELERYINSYRDVRCDVDDVARRVPDGLADAFFTYVQFPVYDAYDRAEMYLQAQEARLIGRPQNFHHDEEALESAARSLRAWEDLCAQTGRFLKINGGQGRFPDGQTFAERPQLPDTLSQEEVERYYDAAPVLAKLVTDNCVVRNAADYTEASEGAELVPMLGHSMRAVSLPAGGVLRYRFYADDGRGVLRLACVPTLPFVGGLQQVSVSIDGGTPAVLVMQEAKGSSAWLESVRRGQVVRSVPVSLGAGSHTLEIRAIGDHVVVDQWMVDGDAAREFYAFPVR